MVIDQVYAGRSSATMSANFDSQRHVALQLSCTMPVHNSLIRRSINGGARLCLREHNRYTPGAGAIEAGADIIAVKELAGHSCIETTMKYLKAANPALKRAVSELAACRPMEVPSESLTKEKAAPRDDH